MVRSSEQASKHNKNMCMQLKDVTNKSLLSCTLLEFELTEKYKRADGFFQWAHILKGIYWLCQDSYCIDNVLFKISRGISVVAPLQANTGPWDTAYQRLGRDIIYLKLHSYSCIYHAFLGGLYQKKNQWDLWVTDLRITYVTRMSLTMNNFI